MTSISSSPSATSRRVSCTSVKNQTCITTKSRHRLARARPHRNLHQTPERLHQRAEDRQGDPDPRRRDRARSWLGQGVARTQAQWHQRRRQPRLRGAAHLRRQTQGRKVMEQKDDVKLGRLAMRHEGNFWVAYYALPESMEGAVLLGSIAMRFVDTKPRRDAFMEIMKKAVADLLQDQFGERPTWPDGPQP